MRGHAVSTACRKRAGLARPIPARLRQAVLTSPFTATWYKYVIAPSRISTNTFFKDTRYGVFKSQLFKLRHYPPGNYYGIHSDTTR
jgi:hypothetical protein